MDIFTSSVSLSMGGAGYLKPSPLSSDIIHQYMEEVFSASIIKYPAGIASQNIGISFLFKNNTFGKFSINNISYGIFEGYDENLILQEHIVQMIQELVLLWEENIEIANQARCTI